MGRVVVAVIVVAVAVVWGGCVVSPEDGPSYGGWTRIEDTGLPGWWYDTGTVDPPDREDAGDRVPLDAGAATGDTGVAVDVDEEADAGVDTERDAEPAADTYIDLSDVPVISSDAGCRCNRVAECCDGCNFRPEGYGRHEVVRQECTDEPDRYTETHYSVDCRGNAYDYRYTTESLWSHPCPAGTHCEQYRGENGQPIIGCIPPAY